MAQKVNPIALRLKINRDPECSWFSDYHYAKLFLEETHLRDYLFFIRQASGNKFGIRLAKCSVHHYPKKSLIHLFCLEKNTNNKLLKVQENLFMKTKTTNNIHFNAKFSLENEKNSLTNLWFQKNVVEQSSSGVTKAGSKAKFSELRLTQSVYSYHNTLKLPFLDNNKKQSRPNTVSWSKHFDVWFSLFSNKSLLVHNSLVSKKKNTSCEQQNLYEKVYKELIEKNVLHFCHLAFPVTKQTANEQQQVTLIAVLPKVTRILLEHFKTYFDTDTDLKRTPKNEQLAYIDQNKNLLRTSELTTNNLTTNDLTTDNLTTDNVVSSSVVRSSVPEVVKVVNSTEMLQQENEFFSTKLENSFSSKQFVLLNSLMTQANELIVKMGLLKIHFSVSNKAKAVLRFLEQASLKHSYKTKNLLKTKETYFLPEEKYWLLANMSNKAISFKKLVKTQKLVQTTSKQQNKALFFNHLFYCCGWTQNFKNEVLSGAGAGARAGAAARAGAGARARAEAGAGAIAGARAVARETPTTALSIQNGPASTSTNHFVKLSSDLLQERLMASEVVQKQKHSLSFQKQNEHQIAVQSFNNNNKNSFCFSGLSKQPTQKQNKNLQKNQLTTNNRLSVFEESRCISYMNYVAMLYWLHFKTSLLKRKKQNLNKKLFSDRKELLSCLTNDNVVKLSVVTEQKQKQVLYDIVNQHLNVLTISTLSPALTETCHSNMSHIQTILSNQTNTLTAIVPIQISSIYQSASLIAQDICCKLQQKKAFRQICKIIFQQIALSKFVKGIRISCSGRINGAEIAKTECKKFGETSLHVFSDQIDYAYCQAFTAYGTLGVKVWVSYI